MSVIYLKGSDGSGAISQEVHGKVTTLDGMLGFLHQEAGTLIAIIAIGNGNSYLPEP